MNDQVELVKSKIDIVEVIGERVVLKKAGRHFKGLCPFHSEKSPSFIVSAERQSFKCFGCQKGGDVLTFLQDYDGMSFLEALEMLAKRVGVTLESYRPTSQDAYKKKLLEIASLASEYYHYLLTKHASGSEAREYLKSRGIGSEAITQFNLGYAPNQWRSVSDFLILKKKYQAEDLEAVGLVIRKDTNSFYDRFRGRVMFPLKDHKGVVVGFSGRTLLKDEKEAKYINSPETMLYSKSKMLYGLWENREYIRKENGIVLVEGELDMIPSWQAGVKNVAAIKGSAFTNEQAQLISRFTKNVAMSLDSDSAGQEAIKRAVIIAESMDLSIRVVQIKGGKDPGDVATTNARSWREMVTSAVLYWDFLIDSAIERNDPKTGDGARIISNEVVPALGLIANSVMRAHYVSELAKKLSVPEESIYLEINRSNKKKELNILKQTVSSIEKGQISRREEVEQYLLALCLQFFEKVSELLPKTELVWISTPAIAKILDKLLLADPKKEFKIQVLAADLPPELQPILDTAYLKDLSRVEEPLKEFEKTLMEIRGMWGRAELKKLASEIGEAEKKGEVTEELQSRFVTLSKSLSGIM
jgi:DNA primase